MLFGGYSRVLKTKHPKVGLHQHPKIFVRLSGVHRHTNGHRTKIAKLNLSDEVQKPRRPSQRWLELIGLAECYSELGFFRTLNLFCVLHVI